MEEATPVPATCSGAGGSGGSIYVTTNALEGAGTLSANGGVRVVCREVGRMAVAVVDG